MSLAEVAEFEELSCQDEDPRAGAEDAFFVLVRVPMARVQGEARIL